MQNDRGFSLAEVAISAFLVMTGLLAMGHTMGTAIKTNYRTSQEGQAMAYALEKVEALRTLDYAHADLTTGAHSDTPATGFSRSWSVSTAGTAKSITLTVTRSIPQQTQPVRVVLSLQKVQ
jgi:Tfp pilus assembly protein PilV